MPSHGTINPHTALRRVMYDDAHGFKSPGRGYAIISVVALLAEHGKIPMDNLDAVREFLPAAMAMIACGKVADTLRNPNFAGDIRRE